eukprot:169649-Amphidinium_carterae.2
MNWSLPKGVHEVENEEPEEPAPWNDLLEEQVPVPPRQRQVQFAEDLVQYEGDQVDSGARGSGDIRTPSVPYDHPTTTSLWYPTQCA